MAGETGTVAPQQLARKREQLRTHVRVHRPFTCRVREHGIVKPQPFVGWNEIVVRDDIGEEMASVSCRDRPRFIVFTGDEHAPGSGPLMGGAECSRAGLAAKKRGIRQAGACQHQLGKASNGAAKPRIRNRNGPDQQLGEIDVGIKAPREGVTAVETEREQPDNIRAPLVHAWILRAAYECPMNTE